MSRTSGSTRSNGRFPSGPQARFVLAFAVFLAAWAIHMSFSNALTLLQVVGYVLGPDEGPQR